MPDMTPEQRLALIAQIAPDIYGHHRTRRGLEATLGALSDAEEQYLEQQLNLCAIRRRVHKLAPPRTKAEQKRIDRKRERALTLRAVADPARRAKLEKDCCAWLRHYMPAAFDLPMSRGHRAMVAGAIRAAKTGTGVAVAAPRGEGKTSILRGVSLYLVATGACRFPVLAGWTFKAASEGFRVWLRMLHTSPEFQADYPEITQPFEESTHSARIKNLTWEHTGQECGAEIRAVERCIILPGSSAAIAAASVQGDVKGLTVTLHDGTVLRPDLLLIDDAQDPARADNPEFVADVVSTIEKQWMCLAGPQSRITTMVACTVAAAGDVSEHFLTRPDFHAVRVARVESWPNDWDVKGSATRKLWDEWHDELLEGFHDGDNGVRGRKFYRAHKAEMARGMKVSWAQRMDKKRKDPDAMYSAMMDFYRIGEAAFASEYQNKPLASVSTIYALTPEIVMSRTDEKRPAFDKPQGTVAVIYATDINHYGLHSVCVGFRNDQSAAVLWYGRNDQKTVPDNAPEMERRKIVFEMLVLEAAIVSKHPSRPQLWVIDGGYEHETVQRFATRYTGRVGCNIVVARGYAGDRYKPWGKNVIGKAREQCHLTEWPMGRGLAWNADYWREISQRAWLGEVGAPGACSLFTGHHREFAEQVTRYRLGEKLEGKMGTVWRWVQWPGWHDYADSMSMAYAGAAFNGIGTAGLVDSVRRSRKIKVKHVRI